MAKLLLTDITGRNVAATSSAIHQALHWYTSEAGFSHVTNRVNHITLWRWRDVKNQPYHYHVIESCYSLGRFVDIVDIVFPTDEEEDAIKCFLDLCKRPTKDIYKALVGADFMSAIVFPEELPK